MKKILTVLFFSLISECSILAQQGYWFQNHFIELESDNSFGYYVQLIGKTIPEGDNAMIIKKLIKCDNVTPVNQNGFVIHTTERPVNQNIYVSDIYRGSISDYVIILPSISFEMVDGESASDILCTRGQEPCAQTIMKHLHTYARSINRN